MRARVAFFGNELLCRALESAQSATAQRSLTLGPERCQTQDILAGLFCRRAASQQGGSSQDEPTIPQFAGLPVFSDCIGVVVQLTSVHIATLATSIFVIVRDISKFLECS